MRILQNGFGAFVVLGVFIGTTATDLPRVYSDPAFGFSVRYPDNLRPTPRDLDGFKGRELGWEQVLDFVTLGPESTTELRIIVKRVKLPSYPPMSLLALRTGCKTYRETLVGGRPAGICVTCGRAACSWAVHVPGSVEFSIISLDRAASGTASPEDGDYPVKSMIESIRFEGEAAR